MYSGDLCVTQRTFMQVIIKCKSQAENTQNIDTGNSRQISINIVSIRHGNGKWKVIMIRREINF